MIRHLEPRYRSHHSSLSHFKLQPEEPADHGLGRSRGGFGSKIHILVDAKGTPLEVEVTAGQVHESQLLEPVLKKVRIKQARGRPRNRPKQLAGDKGYSSGRIRSYLKNRGIDAVIPHRDDETARHDPKVVFDREAYRRRSIVEQVIGWMKEYRRIATRFEKLVINFLSMVKLAMIRRSIKLLF